MKYKVLTKQPHWEVGDIVQMNDLAANEALKIGAVEPYEGDEPPKHAWFMAEPISLSTKAEELSNNK